MNTEHCSLIEWQHDWELILTRKLDHPREEVWAALTRAEEMVHWGPFRPSRDLTSVGVVQLTHMNNPQEDWRQGYVLEVQPPHLLIFRWGPDILRWELEEAGSATLLTLRHRFADREMAPSYAAGWHLCLKGLIGTLAGMAMPSMVGSEALKHGYKELYREFAEKFKNSKGERE